MRTHLIINDFVVCAQGEPSAWRAGEVTASDVDTVVIAWDTADERGEACRRGAVVSTHSRADLIEHVAIFRTWSAARAALRRALSVARAEGVEVGHDVLVIDSLSHAWSVVAHIVHDATAPKEIG